MDPLASKAGPYPSRHSSLNLLSPLLFSSLFGGLWNIRCAFQKNTSHAQAAKSACAKPAPCGTGGMIEIGCRASDGRLLHECRGMRVRDAIRALERPHLLLCLIAITPIYLLLKGQPGFKNITLEPPEAICGVV